MPSVIVIRWAASNLEQDRIQWWDAYLFGYKILAIIKALSQLTVRCIVKLPG